MAEIKRKVSLINESHHEQINYTAMTDAIGFAFEIMDFVLSENDGVRLYVLSPSGALSYTIGEIDLAGNQLLFSVPTGFFPESGYSYGQIRIIRDGARLYSNQIKFNIHPYHGGA